MAQQPSIDPRYDPAFQRGFHGDGAGASGRADAAPRVAEAPRVTSALSRPPVAAPRVPQPSPVDGRSAGPAASGPSGPSVPAEPAEATAAPAPTVVHVAMPHPTPPWANPFAIVAAILGIGSLGYGGWALQEAIRIANAPSGFETQADYLMMQWGMWGGAVFAGVGVAVIAGVFLFCAAYWSRRPRGEE